MGRLLWLPEVLRAAGCKVYEMSGWQTSGSDRLVINAVIWHHTATSPSTSDIAVRRLLRNGRPDLAGPLSQLGLRRDGTFDVIASGRANHNGYGTFGNDSLGIEAYNDGMGEPWPRAQLDAYDLGTAAILNHLGLDSSRVLGHKESDPGRKIDPRGIDMAAARDRIDRLLHPPLPSPSPQEDDVFIAYAKSNQNWWLFEPTRRTLIPREDQDNWTASGVLIVANVSDDMFSRLGQHRDIIN